MANNFEDTAFNNIKLSYQELAQNKYIECGKDDIDFLYCIDMIIVRVNNQIKISKLRFNGNIWVDEIIDTIFKFESIGCVNKCYLDHLLDRQKLWNKSKNKSGGRCI